MSMQQKKKPTPHSSNILWLYDISLFQENVQIEQNIPENTHWNMSIFSDFMRRKILSDYLKTSSSSLSFSISKHGKPNLPSSYNLEFSVSHTKTYWTMILSRNGKIGIDIEQHKERKNMEKIIANYFHPKEYNQYKKFTTLSKKKDFFYYVWTRKEAHTKFLGEGLSYDISSNCVIDNSLEDIEFLTTKIFSGEDELSVSISRNKICNANKISVKGNMKTGFLKFFT